MAEKPLQGFRVAILAAHDFEEAELLQPRQALEQAGAETVVVSPDSGEIQAMQHDEKTKKVKVDVSLDEASPEMFDGVLLPGGALNADKLRVDRQAQAFVRSLQQTGKPMAIICHAPWLLVSAGLVQGRKLTSYYTIQDDIRNAGGKWEDREVVRDRNWVTSRQPGDIPAFNREMIALFAEARAKRRKAA
jgi:protease I